MRLRPSAGNHWYATSTDTPTHRYAATGAPELQKPYLWTSGPSRP
ncbi:hypothetical protein ACLM45_01095 [Synechococcus sp. A10-1-5-9]